MQETTNQNGPTKDDLVFAVNTISGVCTAPFWDEVYAQTVSLDSIKGFQSAFEALHSAGKDIEAMRMLFALHDLVEKDLLPELEVIAKNAEIASAFIGEFLADTEDLMYDYGAELIVE